MVRDNLELADDSLFIDKIKQTFTTADGNLLIKAYTFSKERGCGLDSTPFKAAKLLIDQGADALTSVCALLAPLLWQDLVDPDEIEKNFDPTIAAELKGLDPPSILRSDTRQYCREDVHFLLASMGRVPRKALLFNVFRLLALENTTDSHETTTRKMKRTGKTLEQIMDRIGLRVIVKVNGKTADIDRHLRDGDSIEVLVNGESPGRRAVDYLGQIHLPGICAQYPFDTQPAGLETLGNRSPP